MVNLIFRMPGHLSWSSWLPYISFILWSLAVIYGLAGIVDLVLLFTLTLLRNWKSAHRILQNYDLGPFYRTICGVMVAFILTQISKLLRKGTPAGTGSMYEVPKPLFFPARTSHTRLFPKVHSFSYSYLLVGIPVGWQGTVRGLLAADQGSHGVSRGGVWRNSCWYSIDAADYLDRGNGHLGLAGKLKGFLTSQGIVHRDYPYAYLITAPKFLGYSFNPVSFWYLYSAKRELRAMILEVNNTFDERRMYFLKAVEDPGETSDSSRESFSIPKTGQSLSDASQAYQKPTRFTNTWAKDFHVSPFNSRKGTYSLVAYDPLYPSMAGQGPVNNTITLASSKAHSKIVARLFSEGTPIDPLTMDKWQTLSFLVSWWWVGLVTFPRIAREASKLFFKRKLHVWFRPEPLKDSMGRHADATEKVLEASFRKYLRYLVESNASPLVVKYTAAGVCNTSEEIMTSDLVEDNPSIVRSLEFKVLTPVFYSRFIHYAHDLEAFFSEFKESGTIWLSEPSILPQLAMKKPSPPHLASSPTNFLCFKAIQKLRNRPAPILSADKSRRLAADSKISESRTDIRAFRLSAMDGYILAGGTPKEQKKYRTAVLKVFVSDYVGYGSVEVLKAELVLVKLLIAWWLAGSVLRI